MSPPAKRQRTECGLQVQWNDDLVRVALLSLIDSEHRGLRPSGSFKTEAWNLATRAVQDAAPSMADRVTKQRVKSRVETDKTRLRLWQEYEQKSGFGLNSNGYPTSDASVLRELYAANPRFKCFKDRPLPNVEELRRLFDDSLATGCHAQPLSVRARLQDEEGPDSGAGSGASGEIEDEDEEDDTVSWTVSGADNTDEDTFPSLDGSVAAASLREAVAASPAAPTASRLVGSSVQPLAVSPTPRKRKAAEVRDSTPTGVRRKMTASERIVQGMDEAMSANLVGFKELVGAILSSSHQSSASQTSAVDRASDILFKDFTHLPPDALAIAAEALENESTARVFCRAPVPSQEALVDRYLARAGWMPVVRSVRPIASNFDIYEGDGRGTSIT